MFLGFHIKVSSGPLWICSGLSSDCFYWWQPRL